MMFYTADPCADAAAHEDYQSAIAARHENESKERYEFYKKRFSDLSGWFTYDIKQRFGTASPNELFHDAMGSEHSAGPLSRALAKLITTSPDAKELRELLSELHADGGANV